MDAALLQAPPTCADHSGQRVTRSCSWCRKPMCPRCSFEEGAGSAVLCAACALHDIEVKVTESQQISRAAIARHAAAPRRWRRFRLAAGALVVAAQLGWVIQDRDELARALSPAADRPWTVGAPAPTEGQGEECARRLFAARIALDRLIGGRGAPPAALPGSGDGKAPFACPASGAAFAYRPAGRDGAVACPDASRHGVKGLTADVSGRPPAVAPR
jgi:hypothetical protein